MRKRVIGSQAAANPASDWLQLDCVAEVEVSSEDPEHPIEAALLPTASGGWRAGAAGQQLIRLLFSPAQRLHRIRLVFVETAVERTQEYLLRGSSDDGRSFREIARQQWNFSPQGATIESEEHLIEAIDVSVLELIITPDIAGGGAIASLAELRCA